MNIRGFAEAVGGNDMGEARIQNLDVQAVGMGDARRISNADMNEQVVCMQNFVVFQVLLQGARGGMGGLCATRWQSAAGR